MEQTLQESVSTFNRINHGRVVRNGESYVQTEQYIHKRIDDALDEYDDITETNQRARLIRDNIDFLLRRYHGYCVKDRIGAHYRQLGLKHDDITDFEHVLPAAVVRDLLLFKRISIEQAMNPPTCILHRDKHKLLAEIGLASKTPDIWNFWNRYADLDIQVQTHDNTKIDMETWNLGTHYDYFIKN
jgi:hypothetical protein